MLSWRPARQRDRPPLPASSPRLTGLDMRILRTLFCALALVAVLVAAGCGGGTKSVPKDAVAVVGGDTITKSEFNFLLEGARSQAKAAKATFPRPGTTEYKSLQDKALAYLVQEKELEQAGKDLGVVVTDADVNKQIADIKKRVFGGNEQAFQTQMKQQGFTLPLLRVFQKGNLLSDRVYKKVTGKVTVSEDDVKKYYNQNVATQFTSLATRDVRHILVGSKKKADDIESQLKGGADFASLAKKYSTDTLSAVKGGKLTIEKGKTVPEFDKVAFSLKTNEISAPVHSQYGWHIIQALGPIKAEHKKPDEFQHWLDKLRSDYAKKISYQTGYAPAATATVPTTTTASTTG